MQMHELICLGWFNSVVRLGSQLNINYPFAASEFRSCSRQLRQAGDSGLNQYDGKNIHFRVSKLHAPQMVLLPFFFGGKEEKDG